MRERVRKYGQRGRRAVRLIALALLAGALLALGALFALRAHRIAALHAEVQAIERRGERILIQTGELKELIARRGDLELIEFLARRELGLILPGEEKYILIVRGP